MTRQRTELQLYQLLWEQIKYRKRLNYGLCSEVSDLRWENKINNLEQIILKDSIRTNMPVRILPSGRYSPFGWCLDEQGTVDRKAFVQRMIETLTKEQSI